MNTRRGLPSGEGPLPKESMMDRLETMASEPESVVGGRMDHEKTLHLRCCLETTHLAFSLPGVLVGHLSSVLSG